MVPDCVSSVPSSSGIRKLYETLWRYAAERRPQVVISLMLLVIAQAVRLTIPWFFGQAVNALQVHGMAGIIAARNYLLLMLAAVGVAWTMHGPARILERFNALGVRERFADALHAKLLAFPSHWHEHHHSGDTVYRVTKATSSLTSFAQSQFIYLQNAASIIGPIAALLFVSRPTGAAAMVGYGLIRRLEAPPDQLEAMGRIGAALVAEHHDVRHEARRLLELFRSAIEETAPRAGPASR